MNTLIGLLSQQILLCFGQSLTCLPLIFFFLSLSTSSRYLIKWRIQPKYCFERALDPINISNLISNGNGGVPRQWISLRASGRQARYTKIRLKRGFHVFSCLFRYQFKIKIFMRSGRGGPVRCQVILPFLQKNLWSC